MAPQLSSKFEVIYTFYGKERPPFIVEATTPEDAIAKFQKVKPAVKSTEIQMVNFIPADDTQAEAARVERARTRIDAIEPETIPERELEYIQSVIEEVRLRFSWPKAVHESVLMLGDRLGVPMPEDARPIDSGKFGGQPMYSLSTELKFPAPSDVSLIPEGGKLSPDGKWIEMSRVTYSLGLRKAGIPINVYTREAVPEII